MKIYDHSATRSLIQQAISEDIGGDFGNDALSGDITVKCLVPDEAQLEARIVAKASGIICGLPVADTAFEYCGGNVSITHAVLDGTAVQPGDIIFRARGRAATLLTAERTILNIVQRLSGTATMASTYVAAIAGTTAKIYDTRKTCPQMRYLQKQAVVAGGAENHRIGLFDMVLIKENHIALMDGAHGPADAVARCRQQLGPDTPIAVEIEQLADLAPVIAANATIVMLDNMGPDLLRQAVAERDRLNPAVHLEATGGITLETIRSVAETGIDRISVGALTHSVTSLDLSMLCEPV